MLASQARQRSIKDMKMRNGEEDKTVHAETEKQERITEVSVGLLTFRSCYGVY